MLSMQLSPRPIIASWLRPAMLRQFLHPAVIHTFLNIDFSLCSLHGVGILLGTKGHHQADVHVTKLLASFAAFVHARQSEARSEGGS